MSDLKRNELIEIIINYNKKQDKHKEALTHPTQYKKEFIREKVAENVEAERLRAVEKVTSFNSGLSSSIKDKKKDISKRKYPNKLGGSDQSTQSLGETQAARGQSFITSGNNSDELILKELENAKANNEIDYFSTVLDHILMDIPSLAEQTGLTEEKRNFYKSAEQLSQEFKEEFGTDEIEQSIIELEETLRSSEGFLLALHSKAEMYLTKGLMLDMTDKVRLKNVDTINLSAKFWNY